MKKYLFIATALAALASCSDNEFVGDVGTTSPTGQEKGAISFTSGSKAVTRAIEDQAAATLLNNNFVLLGTKGTEHDGTVFNNYQANYVTNTANTTESNSDNWEYVGYKNLPNGVGTNVGVIAFAATTTGDINNSTAIDQTIKYWDYAAPQYDFAAYSLGTGVGTTPTYATASAISFATLGTNAYTLTGSADELKACYISDLVTAYNRDGVSDYGKPVKFSFRSLGTKIRLAFYETVPGYSVKDVKFYNVATGGTESATPTLFTSSAVLPSGSGTMTITFPNTGWDKSPHGGTATQSTDYNKAHVAFAATSSTDLSSTLSFGALANLAEEEYKEAEGYYYIGRASNAATFAGGLVSGAGKYYPFLPNETGANLQLRIKYTLVSRDGSGEELTVNNATAVIPAELAQWQPNYAYTYIFKIGDMTNGSTGVDGSGNVVTGLTPITLDAVVVDSETGVQETITTVSEPSITTYAQGRVVTANDEYVADKPIYIIVNNGTSNVALTVGTNANLFTATVETGAAQGISEETVANCFAKGTYDSSAKTYTVTDAKTKKLVLTESSLLEASTQIDAADSPTGNAITVDGAKFTPAAGTNYVFQYVIQAPEAAGNYNETTAAAYNATLPGAITSTDVAYSFTSYGGGDNYDPNTQYGTGIVKVVSTDETWTTVIVLSNNPNDPNAGNFVGQQFKVQATALTANHPYQLYSTAGVAQPIYVIVTESTATEISNYNATLTGAVSNGDAKPAIPGKYQYKVIKVASGD